MPKDFAIKNCNTNVNSTTFTPDNTRVSKPPVELFPAIKCPSLTPQPENLLVKTAGGKTYDLKQLILDKISKLSTNIYKDLVENSPTQNEINNWIKKYLLGHKLNSQEVCNNIWKLERYTDKADNVKDLFEYSTGEKYTQENLDKFVKGKIGLKIDYDYKLYKKEKAPYTKSAPFITNDYQETKDKANNEGKSYKLTPKQQVKYNIINKALDKKYREKLEKALKYGKLTEDKSQSQSVLDSLHRILTTPRVKGLDGIKLVQECLDIMENPNIITQLAEDIPEEYLTESAKRYYDAIDKIELNIQAQSYNLRTAKNKEEVITKGGSLRQPTKQEKEKYIEYELKHRWAVGTCAAASIEYDLATKQPANFFALVEQLTSPKGKITKKNYIHPLHFIFNTQATGLNTNNPAPIPIGQTDFTETIELKADEEAYYLAKIQNNHKDKHERSMIDILTQSMIMNLGSGNIYNSLTDRRKNGKVFELENSGLKANEVDYAKNVLTGNESYLAAYASYSPNGRTPLLSKKYIKEQLLEAIKNGENIVVTYTTSACGHAITIIDYITNDNGEGFFVCQDSCNQNAKPEVYDEDFILSHIAHANYKKDNAPLPPESLRKQKSQPMQSQISSINEQQMSDKQVIVLEDKIITPWNRPEIPQILPISNIK